MDSVKKLALGVVALFVGFKAIPMVFGLLLGLPMLLFAPIFALFLPVLVLVGGLWCLKQVLDKN